MPYDRIMSTALQGDPIQATESESELLRRIDAVLSSTESSQLTTASGERIPLPASLIRTVRESIAHLMRGDAVFISSLHHYLTTTEAGDFLGVSRQYLTRLIDADKIPCTRVGRHRRILLNDLLAYRTRSSQDRREALARMTEVDAAHGAYDRPNGPDERG